jgi:hypothetical protein
MNAESPLSSAHDVPIKFPTQSSFSTPGFPGLRAGEKYVTQIPMAALFFLDPLANVPRNGIAGRSHVGLDGCSRKRDPRELHAE